MTLRFFTLIYAYVNNMSKPNSCVHYYMASLKIFDVRFQRTFYQGVQ